jgi:hypothetical protein
MSKFATKAAHNLEHSSVLQVEVRFGSPYTFQAGPVLQDKDRDRFIIPDRSQPNFGGSHMSIVQQVVYMCLYGVYA